LSKREDAGYLKKLSKVYKSMMIEWAKEPLVIVDSSSDMCVKSHDLAEEIMVGLVTKGVNDNIESVLAALPYIPLNSFLFLDKIIPVKNPEKTGVMPYNYFYVTNVSEATIRIEYPSMYDGCSILNIDYSNDVAMLRFYHDNIEYTKSRDTQHINTMRFMVAMMVTVLAFFKTLYESDLYAVETKGVQHRKTHDKKPWARSDLVTVQFLNKLPSVNNREHKGGTHSSPRYHQRRGTWRKMTNLRFKNHPKYGDKIWVKPYWVGSKEATVNGVTYKVM